MRRALLLTVLVALGAPLTMPAAAAQAPAAPEYDWSGRLTFPETVLIAAGETLRVAPGTIIDGAGRVQVEGSLVVNGTASAPVVFQLPVHLAGQGSSTLRHTRFDRVNATALNVSAGEAILEDVTFAGNGRALRVSDQGRVSLARGNVTDHVGEAIYAEGSATLDIADTTFARNGRGLVVYSAARLTISDSRFEANEQHVVVDLWPWSEAGAFTFQRNEFLAPTPSAAALPAVHLRHDGSLSQERPRQLIQLEGNRIEGAPVGLRAEGRALIVESLDDVFVDNALGVSVQLASVTLRRPVFDNDRDFEGTVVLVDPVTQRDGVVVPTPAADPPRPWLPWAVGGAVALVALALAALAWGRSRAPTVVRRNGATPRSGRDAEPALDVAPPTVGADEPAGAPPAGPGPAPRTASPRAIDLATPITTLERRILEDIVANPGTSQRAVADRLGYTRQALHYHVKRLEARGLVEKALEGRETRCAVPAEVARALSTPAVTQTGSQEKA